MPNTKLKKKNSVVKYNKYGYIFCAPFVIAFLIFSLYPILFTASISFSDLQGVGTNPFNIYPLQSIFYNYFSVLTNPIFQKSLATTAIIWIANFIPQIGFAMLLAIWFTSPSLRVRGQGAFKMLLFMPNIITAGTVAVLFYALFSYPIGPVNSLFMSLGLTDAPTDFLRMPSVARGIISFIQFWMWYGNTMIVLVAGVMGINPSLFEAASIDGANGWDIFRRITLPSLRTIVLYVLVTSVIGGLQIFDIPKLLNNGAPNNATQTVSLYIYNQAFTGSYQFNRAAAASMIMFIIAAILSGAMFFIMRDPDEAAQKKADRAAKRRKGNAL